MFRHGENLRSLRSGLRAHFAQVLDKVANVAILSFEVLLIVTGLYVDSIVLRGWFLYRSNSHAIVDSKASRRMLRIYAALRRNGDHEFVISLCVINLAMVALPVLNLVQLI